MMSDGLSREDLVAAARSTFGLGFTLLKTIGDGNCCCRAIAAGSNLKFGNHVKTRATMASADNIRGGQNPAMVCSEIIAAGAPQPFISNKSIAEAAIAGHVEESRQNGKYCGVLDIQAWVFATGQPVTIFAEDNTVRHIDRIIDAPASPSRVILLYQCSHWDAMLLPAIHARDCKYAHHREIQEEVKAILQLDPPARYKSLDALSESLEPFRSVYQQCVSWARFDEASIAAIAQFIKSRGVRSVLELFAGRGLLARLLSSMLEESSDGGTGLPKILVVAADTRISHGLQDGDLFYPVQCVDSVAAAKASNAGLLIYCWAPNKNKATAAAFQEFKGDYFIHIGEDEFGCTDTPRFFEILDSDWTLLGTHSNPTFGMNDCISFYCRNGSV